MIIKDLLKKVLINQRLVIIDQKKTAVEAATSMVKNKCGALLVCDSNNRWNFSRNCFRKRSSI